MPRLQPDQAEGLRRMLTPEALRVVTLMSGKSDAGKSTAAINISAALAAAGRDVLLIDENPASFGPGAGGSRQAGSGNIATALDLKARFDLAHVICGDAVLEQAILQGPRGVAVLPAARGAQALSALDEAASERLAEAFARIGAPLDYVLIDTAPGCASRLLTLDVDNQEVVIVLSKAASSITEAYALVKMMNQRYAQRHFHVLVNRVAAEPEALVIYRNMAQVARGYLAVSLDFMGFVPPDEHLRQSRQLNRSVLEAFPACAAAASFRGLAERIAQWPAPRAPGAGLKAYVECVIRAGRMASAAATPSLRVSNFK